VKTAFAAVPYKGGLVFAGERDVTKARSNPWNGRSFLDIYQVERKGSVFWKPAVPLKGKVNGPYHEGPVVFSTDGRTLYFTRSNYYGRKLLKDEADVSHLKLFRATLDDEGEWSDIREFAYNSEEWSVGHPALSNDGRILYFVSDMPGGQGGTDIWRCTDNGQGWEKPENLGLTINTPGNEMFPTVNGDALYFSSTAHENMGGLDIFETRQQGSQWVEPRNMLYPINTAHDDFSFVLDSTGNGGFLSSDRTGLDRIHAFTMNQPDFILEGEVVDDPSGRFLPHTEVQLVPLDGGDTLRGLTDEEGKFHFALKPGTQYTLRAERDAMITASTTISTVGLTSSGTLHERLGLRGFELDKPIALDNIYYDYDKWDIRPDAAAELDKLAKLITDNPQLNFELSSHTDSRGGDMYNLVLSDARANSAVDYLLRVGVDPERLRPQGYGESKLINGCGNGERCTEEEHQANRRTEFKVVSVKEMAVTP
jgi:peptidoglycan-associated lipoprotein